MISIKRLSTGGYKITENGRSGFASKVEYTATDSYVQIILPGGSFNFSCDIYSPENIAVNEVRTFTTTAQVAAALDAIGAGMDKFQKPAQPAEGTAVFATNPADEDTITIDDGVVTAKVFEFSGIKSAGSVSLAANPANGNVITLDPSGDLETIFEFDSGVAATGGALTFTAKPEEGAQIIFDQGGANETTFIFLAAPAGATDFEEITVGATAVTAMAAFITKFNSVLGTPYTATAAEPADNTCTIAADAVGTAFNAVVALNSANITAVNLSGGLNAGTAVTAGNIGIAIGASTTITMAAFVAAFNANVAGWTAFPSAPADGACTIVADEIGTTGDIGLTRVGANITVVAPTGGANSGTNLTVGHLVVPMGASATETAENLATAINEAAFGIFAEAISATVFLTNLVAGTTGNIAVTTTAAEITVTGMTGGAAKIDISSILTALAALLPA